MSIEERLERLERQNKWMRRIGAVGVALVAAIFLLGQGKEQAVPSIKARELVLVDEAGAKRASLTTKNDKTQLAFFDKKGKAVVELTALRGSGRLSLSWPSGWKKPHIAVETQRPAGSLVIFDKDGNVIWQVPR